jgi:hypothetical protein
MLPTCEPSTLSKEERARWVRGILTLSVVIAVVIVAAAWVGRQLPLGSPGRIALALLQGLANTTLIVALARPMRHYDELQRRIQLEGVALRSSAPPPRDGIRIPGQRRAARHRLGGLDLAGNGPSWIAGLVIANRRYR